MFGKKEIFEIESNKYISNAKEYLHNQEKTEGLLKKAIKKANDKKGSLSEVWDKLQLLLELIKAYSKGEYKNVSKSTIMTVIGAILYFVSPLDIVPDFLVGIGLIDDAAVIGYTLKKLGTEIEEFKKWKHTSLFTQQNPFD
ncbi:YkvA family protein [Neobacillus pocheonensis]|uniref:YkvA family protein n=1 Tax=Neobacillus pocheonensis TaxID=363869 RepID=UPI003D27247D